jgi:hypothetical protein
MRVNFQFFENFLNHPGRIWQYVVRNIAIKRSVRKVLKKQGVPHSTREIKPVYFFGRYGSIGFKLGGSYLIEGLKMAGIRANPGYHASIETVRDSILIFVKEPPTIEPAVLKRNGNKIVIDMRDNFFYLSNSAGSLLDFTDYIILANKNLLNRMSSIRENIPRSVVFYGFADPAISVLFRKYGHRTFSRIEGCYFGYERNLDFGMLKILQEKIPVTVIPMSPNSIEKLTDFNMHIDLRENIEENMYKPLTKVLIAAECNSNIILEKTPRILELLPHDYPFFVSRNNQEYTAKQTEIRFGSPEWTYALSIMAGIREKYTFHNHIASFIKMLEELS